MNKAIAIFLSAVLLSFACPLAAKAGTPSKEDREKDVANVKTAISKLGTGPAAYIEVKLRDGTRLKGYLDEAREDDFTVVDAKSGKANNVPYPQVRQVKGNNLSTGTKVAIGVGVAIGVVILIVILKPHIDAY